MDCAPSGQGVLVSDSEFEKEEDLVKEGLFSYKGFVKAEMKTGWGVSFFLRSMLSPVKKFIKRELEFDGIDGDARGTFQNVEPLFYFVWKPKKRVRSVIEEILDSGEPG